VSEGTVVLLVVWGTLVGLDLVSVPQMMIARPLVAGTFAGLLVGDLEAGLRLGIVFELFQFDILPVGAARYPEYGPATVAAVAAAHWLGRVDAWGIGVGLGLLVALFAGNTLHWLRTANARAVRRAAAQLESGDVHALARIHATGLARDVARSGIVTVTGLAAGWLLWRAGAAGLSSHVFVLTSALGGGAALAAGVAGLLRIVGRGAGLRWFAAGLAGGVVALWIA
jgi:mannose/fructose/N-acetylgalactosamine-specific phosphotransferase system component IIC